MVTNQTHNLRLMKKIIILLLFVPIVGFAQKREVKNNGQKTEIVFDKTYIVERDTSGDNSITIRLIPAEEVKKELEHKLGELQSQENNIDIRINELQERKKVIKREIKEIEKLIQDINKTLKNR